MSTDPEELLHQAVIELLNEGHGLQINWSQMDMKDRDAVQVEVARDFFRLQVHLPSNQTTFRWRDDKMGGWQEEDADFMPTLVERLKARVAALY